MKYRILKKYLDDTKEPQYYPQYKFLFWWCNIRNDSGQLLNFTTYNSAARIIDNLDRARTFKDNPSEYIPGTVEKITTESKVIKIPGISETILAYKDGPFESWKIELFDDQVKKLELSNEQE